MENFNVGDYKCGYQIIMAYIEREECENAIAKYVFGTDDINYKQAKILQAMFNTDEIIDNYRNNCSDWNLAIEKYIYDNNVNRR